MKKFTTLIKPQSEGRKMKRFIVLLVLAAMVAFVLPQTALAQTWYDKYEANELPENATPSWTYTYTGTPSKSVSGGILTLTTNAGSTYKYKRNWGADDKLGITWESRLDFTVNPDIVLFSIEALDGTYGIGIQFRSAGKGGGEIEMIGKSRHYYSYSNSKATTGYHKYRLKLQNGYGYFYEDDVLVLEGAAVATTNNYIAFGQYANTVSSTIKLDYLYYSAPATSPAKIGDNGFFYLNGSTTKTIMKGIEEERSILSDAQVNALIPKLKDMGINFMVIYEMNMQRPYFYQQMEANGIWISQHVGTAKKEMYRFPGTGGIIGETPDDAWYQQQLARLTTVVNTLKGYKNILFWWMGGEFVEPWINDAEGRATIRNHVAGYRNAIRALDPMGRPFTVSHHYMEAAMYDPIDNPYINYNDLTDLTWFTAVTHMHSCDFVGGTGWYPEFGWDEWGTLPGFEGWGIFPQENALTPALNTGVYLNGGKPIFMGGLYGNAPASGQCAVNDQYQLMWNKWNFVKKVSYNGYSTYHLSQWDGNNIPHRMMDWNGTSWSLKSAGTALKEIATGKSGGTNPTAYWKFNETSGTSASDASGNGNKGTLKNGPVWVAGKVGNALKFDGTNDYVTCGNGSRLNINGAITMTAWIKPGKKSTQRVIQKGVQDSNDGYELSLSSTGTIFVRFNEKTFNDTYKLSSTALYPTTGNTWMHVAATFDGSTIKLYVNGVQNGGSKAMPVAIGINTSPLTIGATSGGINNYYKGLVDEVRIYNRALSAAEILALYNASKSATEVTDTTGVTDVAEPIVPEGYTLSLYPNPFSSSVTIEYSLPKADNVSLAIYNTAGQLVSTLVNEEKPAGEYSVQWNGKDSDEKELSSGMYYCRLTAGKVTRTTKLMLMKE